MKRIAITIMLLAVPMCVTANILPAEKDTEDIMIGVTGMFVEPVPSAIAVVCTTVEAPPG